MAAFLFFAASAAPALGQAPPVITRVDTDPVYLCSTDPLEGKIRGSDFVDGLTVTLIMTGQADVDVSIRTVYSNRVGVDWPMAVLVAGVWDVVVTNPDLQVGTLPAGLTIIACPPFAVTDFDLTHTFTCGERPFRLAGASLGLPATIKLTRPGEADIIATDLRRDTAINDGSLPGAVRGAFEIGSASGRGRV